MFETAVIASESFESRRHRARTLAAFFAAGAVVSTLAVVLPGWPQMHRPGILLTVLAAGTGAVVLVAVAGHVGRWTCHGFTASGTLLIAICQVLAGGGSATATYGMLYIWVVLHSALFFPRRAVAAQIAVTTIAQAAVLVRLDELTSMAPQLALTTGTQVAAALVVGSLATRMRLLADTDALTGLANRRTLHTRLAWHLARSRRTAGATWLALLDLDAFKAFNDTHGHLAGDQLLVETAAAWQGLLRPTDTLARTGGDEFTVLLTDCDQAAALQVMDRMTAAVANGLACSAGVARWDGHESATRLIERADAALYAAKTRGPVVIAHTLPRSGHLHTVATDEDLLPSDEASGPPGRTHA